jgi:serine/threonine protein kinase
MEDLVGKTINEYQLIEIIDRKGLGYVYKGFQPKMNRYVAVKVLNTAYNADESIVDQFKRQSDLNARLEHRDLVPVYDYGEEEELHFEVSRFMDGGTLRDHLAWFYNASAAQTLIHHLAEGLEYLHNQELVHGNLKPENIYLDGQRNPVLKDYGITRRQGVAPNAYMSPEQTQGSLVDKRTDIYALGVILYEVLVGEAPPAGTVASPRTTRPDLPEGIEKVIFKAMAQNPDERYQTAGEFSRALEAVLKPKAPAAQPVATTTTKQEPAQVIYTQPPPAEKKSSNSCLYILLGGLAIIALIACGLIFGQGLMDRIDSPEATEAPPSTEAPPPTEAPEPTDEPPPTEEPVPTEEPIPTDVPPDQPIRLNVGEKRKREISIAY